jgi:predicted DNA-binding antitoxin AbrB/MazE fold protein
MKTIHAVYEEGVFRPLEKVELPERTEVEFEPKVVGNGLPENPDMSGIIEVLSRRYDTGEHDIAERHNEHQP